MEIGEVHVLQRQEKRDVAWDLMSKVASYVKPLMRKHGLKISRLVEFFPTKRSLYGTNYGRGICVSLRLREATDKNSFLDFETVLETMLHELCHNTFGPHNKKFFALLDSYKGEMYSMRAKGFTGDLFTGVGRVLGGTPRPNTFKKPGKIVKSRGRRLGGSAKLGDRKHILADAAEKRRAADEACAPVSFEEMGVEEISSEEFFRSTKGWIPAPDRSAADVGDDTQSAPEFASDSETSAQASSASVPVIDLTKDQYFIDLT